MILFAEYVLEGMRYYMQQIKKLFCKTLSIWADQANYPFKIWNQEREGLTKPRNSNV